MSDNDHDKEIRSPNAPDLPSKSEIVKLCRKNGLRTFYLTHTHNGTELFIKYLKASVLEKHGSNSSSSISRLPPPKKKWVSVLAFRRFISLLRIWVIIIW